MGETRKARRERVGRKETTRADVSNASGFLNRLRSKFAFVGTLDTDAPLDEPTLDGIQRAYQAFQEVEDVASAIQKDVRRILFARADAHDALFTVGDKEGGLFLGLPIHPKRFSLERLEPSVAWKGLVDSLVADGLLSQDEYQRRVVAFTNEQGSRRLRYLSNPLYTPLA